MDGQLLKRIDDIESGRTEMKLYILVEYMRHLDKIWGVEGAAEGDADGDLAKEPPGLAPSGDAAGAQSGAGKPCAS